MTGNPYLFESDNITQTVYFKIDKELFDKITKDLYFSKVCFWSSVIFSILNNSSRFKSSIFYNYIYHKKSLLLLGGVLLIFL